MSKAIFRLREKIYETREQKYKVHGRICDCLLQKQNVPSEWIKLEQELAEEEKEYIRLLEIAELLLNRA